MNSKRRFPLVAAAAVAVCLVAAGWTLSRRAPATANARVPAIVETTSGPLNEATFTWEGKPIHPGCIEEFNILLSDSGPPCVKAVDVESCMTSNDNADVPIQTAQGFWMRCHDDDPDGYFLYKWLGRTPTGTHVLLTGYCGGGSGVFEDVYLVRFERQQYFQFNEGTAQPQSQHRWMMHCIGQIVLGDRDDGTVELRGSRLLLGKSRYRENAVAYEIP